MYCRNCGKEMSEQAAMCVACGVPSKKGNSFCLNCGTDTSPLAEMCIKCGASLKQAKTSNQDGTGEKKFLIALLLCFFFGCFGIHRFYVGKTGSGIAQLFTLGGLGIWAFVDFIMILAGSFRDKEGNLLVK